MSTYIRTLFVPIMFVAFLILSIVLLFKRKKIIANYDVGYVSSFFFASCMLIPVFAVFIDLASPNVTENSGVPVGIFMIYPIIGLCIFFTVNRGKSMKYQIGKLFAMIGIGICAGYVMVLKMLKIIHIFESDSVSQKKSSLSREPIPNVKITTDIFRGRINEYGEIYDYGGKILARINDNGDIFYPNGEYYAHRDYSGDVYDADGKYLGRIKDGEIQNANWTNIGKLNND